MEFKKKIINHQEIYISGIYKCVKYDKWYAYFKPVGWMNWGNSCERTPMDSSRSYNSLKGAQAACKRHKRRYPEDPQAFDKIMVK
jgi:hypothetical protein